MSRTPLDPRSPRGVLAVAAICGLTLIPAVLAQQQRMMVFESDEGGPPQVLHVAGPDMHELAVPDFVRRDLPVFKDKLDLDGVQQLVVQTLLEAYLDTFRQLLDEARPEMAMPGLGMFGRLHDHDHGPEGHGQDGAGDESLNSIIADAVEQMHAADGDATDVNVEAVGEAGGPMRVAIAVRAGGPGDEDAELPPGMGPGDGMHVWAGTVTDANGGEEGSSVVIALDAPDGVEIPEEVRKRLAESIERLQQRMAEVQAEGVPPEQAVEALMPPPMTPQEHQAMMEQMREAAEKFAKAKAALKEDFLTGVRSQLTAEQLGRWPTFERALTRIKTLPKGRLDGESVDLLVEVQSARADDETRAALAPVLEHYEIDLDRALRERNEFIAEAQKKVDKAISDQDFDAAARAAERASRLRVAVRSVNELYTDAIATKLTDEAAAGFRRQVLRRSYPRVYRTTHAQKTFEAAARLDGLDAETTEAIVSMQAAYEAELAALNERLREVIRREQPQESKQMIEQLQAMIESGGSLELSAGDDPIRTALARRKDLDERYTKQLQALLTPEQVAELPAPPAPRQPFVIQRTVGSD